MRADTTTPEYQRAWRGRHSSANGRCGQAKHYVRCMCGWRLVDVPDRRPSLDRAYRLHAEHVEEMRKG